MENVANIDRQQISKFLYRIAWAIEIIAASVGLFLAIAQIIDSSGDAFNSVLAGIPFFAGTSYCPRRRGIGYECPKVWPLPEAIKRLF